MYLMTTLGAIGDAGAWMGASYATSFPVGCANILFKVSDLDKFLYQVIQTFALLSSVVVILMVEVPFVSISLSQI